MKLEQQVVSLPLAKRLKELGVEQESYFWWWEDAQGVVKGARIEDHEPRNSQGGWNAYAAFTVAELGEMLPPKFATSKATENKFCCWNEENDEGEHATTEADARAKMLVYLIENKLV